MVQFTRRRLRAGLAVAGAGLLWASALPAKAAVPSPVECANPMVGTDDHGHAYPGATVPFGMVQLSPDTPIQGWDSAAGYHYSNDIIIGFSHNHLSGTGVGGLGDVMLMPTVGAVSLDAGKPGSGYVSSFSHSREVAQPGYYKVFLDTPGVLAEMTATERCGVHRYTFPASDAAHLILDLNHGVGNSTQSATLTVENSTTLSGSRVSNGWGGRRVIYFVMEFSRPFDAIQIQQDGQMLTGGAKAADGKIVKAALNYDTTADKQVVVKVGISSTGVDGARRNLTAEVPGFDFDAVHNAATKTWSAALGTVKVDTPDLKVRRTFYTNLYDSLLAPTLFNDVDGAYLGRDHKVHTAPGFQNYSTFSQWDIFRAESPLLTIVQPDRVPDMTQSLLAQFNESGTGRLPIWTLAENETYTMIGYHSVPVIADAYFKGLLPAGKAEEMYQAMRTTAMGTSDGLNDYKTAGYVYSTSAGSKQSVSRTLEYAYDDWCIAKMAESLGHKEDASLFYRRAANYRNVYDSTTGFMRGRMEDGAWRGPFNPKVLYWADYTEANAWQYTWSVMQDVPGLVKIMGGDTPFINKLDGLFSATSEGLAAVPDITGLIGQYAHGNEPVHHVAYLYNYAGAPYKTQARTRQIMNTLYSDTPAGQCGNLDCGQMSAWYVFSAMGFYPVNPAQGVYVIGSPLVSKATIQLDKAHYGGKTLTMIADNNSAINQYIQSATWNGKTLSRSWFTQKELAAGGTLRFKMGPKPNMTWGKAVADRPPTGMPAGALYAALPTPSVPYVPVVLSLPIRVVAGSDTAVGNFIPDPNMQDGAVNSANATVDTSVANSAPAGVYNSERYGSNFTYSFPVPQGKLYTVRLHFAEVFGDTAGQRLENIAINDTTVLSGFDPVVAAGGPNKAVVKEFTDIKPNAKGRIDIHISAAEAASDKNAKISALEILPQ